MECGGPDVPGLLPQHPLQPVLQFIGGLVGEGDGQYLPGAGRLDSAEVGHQRALRCVRRLGVLLQKGHLVLCDGDGDLLRVAAAAIAQQVGHPVDQHGGLTRACAGQEQQRAFRGQHALPLAWVQVLIVHGDGAAPRRDKAFLKFRHGASSFLPCSSVSPILIQKRPAVNRVSKNIEFLFDFT